MNQALPPTAEEDPGKPVTESREGWTVTNKIAAWGVVVTLLVALIAGAVTTSGFGIWSSSARTAPAGSIVNYNNFYGPVSNNYGATAAPTTTLPPSPKCPAVKTPATGSATVYVTMKVKTPTSLCWQAQVTAAPGGTVRYLITYVNLSKSEENQVVFRVNLAPKTWLVPNSTYIYDGDNPKGVQDDSNNIANGGLNIGNFDSGAGGYVDFTVALPLTSALACGVNEFRTVGVVRPQGLDEYYNTGIVDTTKPCSK